MTESDYPLALKRSLISKGLLGHASPEAFVVVSFSLSKTLLFFRVTICISLPSLNLLAEVAAISAFFLVPMTTFSSQNDFLLLTAVILTSDQSSATRQSSSSMLI